MTKLHTHMNMDLVGAANGEIRIMQANYEYPAFYCVISFAEAHDRFWEIWEDLVGGDNEYFNARAYMGSQQGRSFVFSTAITPEEALSQCMKLMSEVEL